MGVYHESPSHFFYKAYQEMIEILSPQEFRAKIPAGLSQGIGVVNKAGSITRIGHDAAIIFPPGRKPYVLVVLTRGIDDHQEAEDLIAGLSRIVFQYVAGKGRTEV